MQWKFKFYKDNVEICEKLIWANLKETAYKKADKILLGNPDKYDDWMYCDF